MKVFFFFLFFLFPINHLFTQNNFKTISTDENLSISEKSRYFDILIQRFTNEDKTDSLITERYEIIKWHRKVGNLKKAIALNRENLILMDSIDYEDRSFYRRNIYSLGYYEVKNDETNNALDNFKRLINYKEPDEYSIKGAYQVAEIYFNTIGDYNKASNYYKLCRSIAKTAENHIFLVRSTVGIGKSCLLLNTSNSIKEGIEVTSSTIQYIENSSDSNVDDYYLIQIYKLLGNLYSDRNDYNFEFATYNLKEALRIAKKSGYEDEVSFINNDLGLIHLKDKRTEAKDYFKNSLKYRTDNVMYAISHRNLAKHYIEARNYELALQSIQKSIYALILKSPTDNEGLPEKSQILSSTSKNQLVSSLKVKSDIWLKLAEENKNKKEFYYEQATKTIELGDWLIDKARLSDIEYKSKLFWRKLATDLYINGVTVSYKTNNTSNAFYYFEKNKALQLLEDVKLKSARKNTQIPKVILEREKKLKHIITELEKQEKSSVRQTTARDLIIAKETYDTFIDSLDTDLQLLYKLEKPAEVVEYSLLKNQGLNSKDVYLEYILNNDIGYGLLISKNQSIIFQFSDLDKLKELSINYRKHLNSPITNTEDLKEFNKSSHELYNLLFPENIRDVINGKRIMIIPDNYLQNIPFEPLITNKDDSKSFLILNNEISYSYSLTFLLKNKELMQKNNSTIIGFAPVQFNDSLPNLSSTKEELASLSKLDVPKVYLFEEANKVNFFTKSKDAQIIHIASHANAIDNISPWISFYDEKLYLNEIYNHDTAADLVVLSACNTSLGEIYKGEGVMSLARGFFHSGSKSVLTTLWTVNDKSTTSIMEHFYENLKNGQSKSAALRKAKLTYIKSHTLSEASPYYWSSFILLGDTKAIDLENGFITLHYFILSFFLLISIFLICRYKAK